VDLPLSFPAEKLAPALNWHLPEDIKVTNVYPVPRDFNPQTWAQGKIYRYFIYNHNQSQAIGRRYSWHVPKPLDITVMNEAAMNFIGTYDFASFQAAGSEVEHTLRTIRHLFCNKQGRMVTITCVGGGFLYNMVRIIVGTLVDTGLGKRQPHQMKAIINARNRKVAGPTAPAKGLFLERVLYRPSLDSYRRL